MPRGKDWTKFDREQRQMAMKEDMTTNDLNIDMVGSLRGKLEDLQDEFSEALDRMKEATSRYSVDQSRIMERWNNKYFEVYRNKADEVSSSFSELMDQIKQFMEEDEIELLEDVFDNQKQQFNIYNAYYQREMKKERKTLKTFFQDAKNGMEQMSEKFGNVTDIVNAINISSIRDSLEGGSDSTVDVISEVARIRGESYDAINKYKESLTEEDTYGGKVSASDIMSVWKITGATDEYLAEISGYMAMFLKETETSNDSVSELVYWSQRGGRTSEDLYKILDDLSSVRQFGGIDAAAITDNLQEMVNYLDPNNISSYIAATAAAQKNDLNIDVLNDALRGMAEGGMTQETIYALSQIESYGRIGSGSLVSTLEQGDYEQMMNLYAEAMKNIAGENGTVQGIIAGETGIPLEEITKYSEINTDEFADLIKSINENTDTVASMSDTVGYVSDWDEAMNKASVSWIGDFFDKFQTWTKDHPILTSIAGAAMTGIFAGVGTVVGGTVLNYITKGKAGKLLARLGKHGDDIVKATDDIGDLVKGVDRIDDAVDATRSLDATDNIVDAAKSLERSAESLDNVTDAAKGISKGRGVWKLFEGVDVAKDTKEAVKTMKETKGFIKGIKKASKKGVGGPLVDLVIDSVVGAVDFATSDGRNDKVEAAGTGIGQLAGDILGWVAAGPIGGLAGGWAGSQVGEMLSDSVNFGIDNYGKWWKGFLLGDKGKTLVEQKQEKWARATAKSKYGGLPSDYGLPEVFDENLDATTGDINFDAMENDLTGLNKSRMESKFGMDVEELEKWRTSDEYKNYLDAENYVVSPKGYVYKKSDLDDLMNTITEGSLEYNAKYDPEGRGYYSVWKGSQDQYDAYLSSHTFWGNTNEKNTKGLVSDAYMQNEIENTEAIKDLSSSIDDLRKYLEDRGKDTESWDNLKIMKEYVAMVNGSHETGLESVPFDGYVAELHKNERVLTASEASALDSIVEPIIQVDGTVINMSETLVSIAEILSEGFAYLGKKMDNIKVNVNNIQKASRQSSTSQFFAGLFNN